MVVIPVLTPLLAAAGKEIASWTDCGSRLRVKAVSVVEAPTENGFFQVSCDGGGLLSSDGARGCASGRAWRVHTSAS